MGRKNNIKELDAEVQDALKQVTDVVKRWELAKSIKAKRLTVDDLKRIIETTLEVKELLYCLPNKVRRSVESEIAHKYWSKKLRVEDVYKAIKKATGEK